MRWGLVPFWAKDIKVGFANVNAMAETVDTKPALREAFQRRRSLLSADGFHEWKKADTGEQPYTIALADRRLTVLAGLWETRRSSAGEGCAISRSLRRRQTGCEPRSTICRWL